MKYLLPLIFILTAACSGEPEQHFIYDVTETGRAHIDSNYTESGVDYEGYSWTESYTGEWASPEWGYRAVNGVLDVEGTYTPNLPVNTVVKSHRGTFSLDTSKLRPTIPVSKQWFTGYTINSTRSFKLVLIEEEHSISENEYKAILLRKKKGLGVWVNNFGYIKESKVEAKYKVKK